MITRLPPAAAPGRSQIEGHRRRRPRRGSDRLSLPISRGTLLNVVPRPEGFSPSSRSTGTPTNPSSIPPAARSNVGSNVAGRGRIPPRRRDRWSSPVEGRGVGEEAVAVASRQPGPGGRSGGGSLQGRGSRDGGKLAAPWPSSRRRRSRPESTSSSPSAGCRPETGPRSRRPGRSARVRGPGRLAAVLRGCDGPIAEAEPVGPGRGSEGRLAARRRR